MSVTVDVDAGGSVTVDVDENAGGPAGGVLAGNYPDPSFAVPMATEAELTAHEAAHPAHPASGVSVASGSGVTATDVQAAIAQIVGFITSQEAGDSAAIAAVAASLTDEIARATTAEATKQAHDADLDTIAALDSTAAGTLASDGAGWIRKTYAQLKTALTLVKGDVGLGNVDNTSDANKPVSTAQAAADATKLGAGSTATYANLAALPAASAHTNEIHKTLDGGVYESTGSAWVQLVAPNGTYASSLARTAVKTSAYAAAAGDLVPVDTTSGAVTVTLPSAPADRSRLAVKHILQGGTNAVTVACGGADVFNRTGGAATLSLSLLAQGVLLEYTASTGVWTIVADDIPLTQLDGRFPQIAASGIIKQTTGADGHQYTLKWQDAGEIHSGTRGLVLSRDSAVNPVGLTLESVAGTPVWDTVTLDATTTDLVMAYSHIASADQIRVRDGGAEGPFIDIGSSVGHPGTSKRLHVLSAATDTLISTLLYPEIANGSSCTDYIRGQFNGVENFNISKNGFAAFGKTYAGSISNGALEVATGATISATVGVSPALQLISSGNATNRTWSFQISTADGGLSIKDVTSGNTPLQIQGAAAANTILIGSNFLRLGAAATSVGFYGSSGAVQSTGWTTMTGTATKAGGSWDTSTVTLPQLAQVVKAIVDRKLAMNQISA